MADSEQREFLINVVVSLLRRLTVYQSLVDWLTDEVKIPVADIRSVVDSARRELDQVEGLDDKLRIAVESALQSGEADFDRNLALILLQAKPQGRPN